MLRLLTYEWAVLRRDASFWLVIGLLATVGAFSLWSGQRFADQYTATQAEAQQDEQVRYDTLRAQFDRIAAGQPVKWFSWDINNPDFFARYRGQRYVQLPPAPLLPLATGQADLQPHTLKIGLTRRDALDGTPSLDNPLALFSGRLDLAFVLLYLFPLGLLGLTATLRPAEQESGTLRMALAGPLSLRHWLWAKLLVRALPLLALATVLLVSGAVLSPASGENALLRVLLFWLATVVYLAFWLAVAFGINAWGRSAAGNAVTAASVWLLFLVVLPSLLTLALQSLHPVPTRASFVSKMREASLAISKETDTLMAKYYNDHPELARDTADFLTEFSVSSILTRERMSEALQPTLVQYERQLAAQQAQSVWLQYLCPPLVAHGLLLDAAGTGPARYQHFRAQAMGYHGGWKQHFEPMIVRKVRMSPTDLDRVPRFQYSAEATRDLISRSLLGSLFLAVVSVALVAVAQRRLQLW